MKYDMTKGGGVVDVQEVPDRPAVLIRFWERPHNRATGESAAELSDAELGEPELEIALTDPDVADLLAAAAKHVRRVLMARQPVSPRSAI